MKNFGNDMYALWQMVVRSFKIFLKDRMSVFFSLLAPLIVLMLYVLFLGDMQLDSVKNILPPSPGIPESTLKAFVDSWMIAGVMGVSCITVSMSANAVMIQDKARGVINDSLSSPVKRWVITASYFVYNFLVSVTICTVVYGASLIYLAVAGDFYLTLGDIALGLGAMLLSVISATMISMAIAVFFRSEAALSAFNGIVSAVSGFLIGAYMPLFMMPKAVQYLCGFVPGTYCCALFRFAFMSDGIAEMTEYLSGVIPEGASGIMAELTGNFGYNLNFFGIVVTPPYQALVIAVFTLIFIVLNVVFGKKLTAVIGGMTKKIFAKKKNKGSRAE